MLQKYLKPKSLTWWCGFLPLAGGVVVAAANTILPAASPLAAFVNEMSGSVPASVLIMAGLSLIGMRGAV